MTKVKDCKTVILIPAYQPSEVLVNLVEILSQQNFEILVVNDGSSENHARIFEKISSKAHIFAIAMLTVGSALAGVLEIYGNTNAFVIWYFVVGGVMLAVSFAMWLMGFLRLGHQSFGENNRRG